MKSDLEIATEALRAISKLELPSDRPGAGLARFLHAWWIASVALKRIERS